MDEIRRRRTRSAGTKLSEEQYATLKSNADAQGLGISEYVREVLCPATPQIQYIHRMEILCHVQLAETMALRSMVINIASAQAAGQLLTSERVQAIRAHADANKCARANVLLAEATNNQIQVALLDTTNEETRK